MNSEDKFEKPENDSDVFSSLADGLGIDENMVEAIKPIFPKIIYEFIRGIPKFAEEERRIQEMMRNSTQEKGGLLVQNIYSTRTFLLTLTGFSLSVIGIVLSTLSPNKELFGHIGFLYFGLILLGFEVVGSVIYLLYTQTIENNKLYNHLNFDRQLGKDLTDLLAKVYMDPTKTFDNYFMEKKILLESKKEDEDKIINKERRGKKNWNAHILSTFFLLGLLSIVISFFWH
jgi:hypothetical protein